MVTEHRFGGPIDLKTFGAVVRKNGRDLHRIGLVEGECVLEDLSKKDEPDRCVAAIIDGRTGVLYLKWNRKQKAKKSLVAATFMPETRGKNL